MQKESLNQKRQFFDRVHNQGRQEFVVEPPMTVGLSSCSAALHGVSCDFFSSVTDAGTVLFLGGERGRRARRSVEGEGKSCRPPLSTPHVLYTLTSCSLSQTNSACHTYWFR